MKIYELDDYDPWGDDYIQTLDFPDCSVVLECWYEGCEVKESSWKNPFSVGPYTNAKIRLKVTGAEPYWE